MSYRESDILYEGRGFFILRVKDGVEVYKNGITHSTRVAGIYFKDHAQNMQRAMAEIDRRITLDNSIRCAPAPQPSAADSPGSNSAAGAINSDEVA